MDGYSKMSVRESARCVCMRLSIRVPKVCQIETISSITFSCAEKHHRQAKSRRIATIVKDRISLHLGTMPAEIIADIRRHIGISYDRSWKGKEFALEEIRGSWEELYRLLPPYVVQLLGIDPAARPRLVREVDRYLLRFFGHLDLVLQLQVIWGGYYMWREPI